MSARPMIVGFLVWLLVAASMAVPAAGAATGCNPPEIRDIEERVARHDAPAPPPLRILYAPSRGVTAPAGRGPETGLLDEVVRELARPATIPAECGTRHPLADTVFMRHPGSLPFVPVSARRLLAAADIARSFDTVEAILRPLLAPDQPRIVRYRAALELMLRALRLPRAGRAAIGTDLMDMARALVPPAGPDAADPAADLDFIEAVLCLETGGGRHCRTHLDAALRRDPWFVAARRLRIASIGTAIAELPRGPRGARRCAPLAGKLLLDIRNMLLGVTRRENRVEIALILQRDAARGSPVLHLGAAHAFIEAGAWRQAEAALDAAAAALTPDSICGTELRNYVDDFRTRLPQE